MPEFFIANPADTDFPFSEDWEIMQWLEETGATITVTRDDTDSDRPSVMKVVSDTDGKGVYYTIETVLESTKYAFSLAYKVDADQEIDYVIYDNSNSGNIQTGTLVESSGEWSYHYEEVTTPASCTEVIIYLRAGDPADGGDAFYVDDLKFLGNALEEDPDEYGLPYPKGGNSRQTLDGTLRGDFSLVTIDFSMSFPYLTAAGFDRLLGLHRTRKETYFDDVAVASARKSEQIYTETTYDFTGISNPSATHIAHEDKSASEPSAQADFETTEITTADYNVLDDDDGNSYQDGASTTGHFQYHKFEFDISSEYTAAEEIQSFEVTYKGAANDASSANQDGVTLYAWNINAGNWVKLGSTRVATKETISRSLIKPEQAQMFVDTTNGRITLLVQTNGTKGAGTALTLDSYYVEVTVNKSRSTTVTLLNRAQLSSGRVIHVKNLTQLTELALGPDYRVADDAEAVIVDGVFATLDGAATYFSGGDNLDAGVNDISFSCWIRRDGVPLTSEYIVQKYGAGVGYALYIDTSGHLASYIEDAGDTVSDHDGANICDGDWHHVAVRFDRSGVCTRFVDGEALSTASSIVAANGDIDNGANFVIGATSAGASFFEGSLCLARLQIAGTLITDAQVLWQFNHGRDFSTQAWTLDGTRGYWKFDDAASAANADGDGMITDGSGGGIHLDAVGGTTTNYGTHSRDLSVDAGDFAEVKYDQYYRVMSNTLSEGREKTGDHEIPGRSVSLSLRGLIGME
jgi:hypothetical protein